MTVTFEPLVRRRRLVVAAYLLVAIAAAPGLLRLGIDNSAEGFFVQDAAALDRFRSLERTFGRDRAVRLVLEGDALWTADGLAWLARLEDGTDAIGGVYGAAGPYHLHRWHSNDWPPADPGAFRRTLQADRVAREAGWISEDGTVVTVLAGLYKMKPERRDATLDAIARLLATAPPGVTASLVGLPVVNRALDEAMITMTRRLFPLLFATGIVLLVVFFRSLRAAAMPLALVAVVLTVLMGAIGYAGQRLDLVFVVIVPLVFVITLATGVHVLAHHRRVLASGLERNAAAVETYRTKAWPVLWTGATTCVGFGSLAISNVPAVRMLGLWTAFGISFLTLAALSFYPALLASSGALASSRVAPAEAWLHRGGGMWAGWAIAHRRTVSVAFGAVALLAAAGLPRLTIETNVLTYFRPPAPLRARIEALESRGLGSMTASLVLERADGFEDAESLAHLQRLAAALRDEPLVLGAVGAGDFVAGIGRVDGGLALARGIPDLRRFLTFVHAADGRHTRILLITPMRSYEELEPLYRRAETLARAQFPSTSVWITGEYPLVLAAQRSLLRTMVVSLAVTALAIAFAFRLLLGSFALTIRALIPNFWPVLIVLGVMGWGGVTVDSATVMIAAIALGLAVDDTIHTLAYLRRTDPRAIDDAVRETLAATAPGHVSSSVILALGFAVCAASSLVPVARFGALSGIAIVAALAADLVLVPALLSTLDANAASRFQRLSQPVR